MKFVFLFFLAVLLPSMTFQYLTSPLQKDTSTVKLQALPIALPAQHKPASFPLKHNQQKPPTQPNVLPTPLPIINANPANPHGFYADSSNNYPVGSSAFGGGSGYGGGYQDSHGGGGVYGGISGYGGYGNGGYAGISGYGGYGSGGYGGVDQYIDGLSAYAPKLSTTIMALGFLAFGAQIASLIIMAINNNNNNANGNGGNEGTLDERSKREILDDRLTSILTRDISNKSVICKLKSECDFFLYNRKRQNYYRPVQQLLLNLIIKMCELPSPECNNHNMLQDPQLKRKKK